MRRVERPSPNWNERPAGVVDTLVLHYTGMASGEAALARLCDPAAEVSAHYVIDEAGTIHALVAEERRAWHAGRSAWGGRSNLNDTSIGIELVNPGHEWGYRPFAEAQMQALTELCRGILARWPIPPAQVLAHADIAPNRKEDPGELFDWVRLAAAGIGRWPDRIVPAPVDPLAARRHLSAIGYALDQPGVTFIQVVTAFQRHYRQRLVNGALDPETMGAILALSPLHSA
ncbi:MAG: N-acetylmuramoyl-L-alanine amidase [Geminicoccaceae bacterium]